MAAAQQEDQSVMTPSQVGPAADPALLGQAGATSDANEIGINMAVHTMQKFGRELEKFPAEGRKLVEKALKSVSSANHRSTGASTVSRGGSRADKSGKVLGEQQDSFVRLVNALVDFSPMPINVVPLIETFVLSSVILTVFSASSLLGGYLLAPFVTLLVPPVGAALFSAIAAPLGLYYQLSKGYKPMDALRVLALTAVAQGVLSGAALANLSVSSEPFIALSVIVSSFGVSVIKHTSRPTSLLITVLSSLIAHTAIGALEGAISPVYLLLSALYTLAAAVPIQLAARDKKSANVNLYSAVLVGLCVSSKLAIYGMLGANGAFIAGDVNELIGEGGATSGAVPLAEQGATGPSELELNY
ncbi:unnamed protein product [Caenorhabditis sp. 36 PRJEB53466]|nr:unnamed protein product [Caenorhabditis sp. 36 PRJEB53466]